MAEAGAGENCSLKYKLMFTAFFYLYTQVLSICRFLVCALTFSQTFFHILDVCLLFSLLLAFTLFSLCPLSAAASAAVHMISRLQ